MQRMAGAQYLLAWAGPLCTVPDIGQLPFFALTFKRSIVLVPKQATCYLRSDWFTQWTKLYQ